jgi:hypothetical protein
VVTLDQFTTAMTVLLATGTGMARAGGIEFGETKTRFEIRQTLHGRTTLDSRAMMQPWYVDWRQTVAWQHGIGRPRPYFAPPGCFIVRRVATPYDVALQGMYICR